ncbi:MAG: hypothetical protein RLZZ210_429 [Pseudomonadota bacterium]|jgi:nucleoside-diphosphate-sugar epimerase
MNNNILITGANGQIGQILTKELSQISGNTVYATDINISDTCTYLNILEQDSLMDIIKQKKITQIYHLAAILSARGEQDPIKTWHINMQGLLNVLEASRLCNLDKVFFPSTIAVFGNGIDQNFTANYSALHPTTVYGISKATGENWCQYYYEKYGLDVRSLRYPGVIGWQTMPGGGTTDYAIDIFHQLIKTGEYTCFLDKDVTLPMLYMEDAIRATLELMHAPKESIKNRASYNIAGCSFNPEQIFNKIAEYINKPVSIKYQPDFRNNIAKSWPFVIDDSLAKQDWGWNAKFDLDKMVNDMLENIQKNY